MNRPIRLPFASSLASCALLLLASSAARAADAPAPALDEAASAAFLVENAGRPGVKTTASGLQYRVVQDGTGPMPKAGDSVMVHYRGTLIDGTEFDSSYKRGEPATFPVEGVIAGWTEALQLMKQGAKWQLFIPPKLAYGANGPLANKLLIFDVELLNVKAPSATAAQGNASSTETIDVELEYSKAKAANDIESYRKFLREHASSQYAPEAMSTLELLVAEHHRAQQPKLGRKGGIPAQLIGTWVARKFKYTKEAEYLIVTQSGLLRWWGVMTDTDARPALLTPSEEITITKSELRYVCLNLTIAVDPRTGRTQSIPIRCRLRRDGATLVEEPLEGTVYGGTRLNVSTTRYSKLQ